MGFHRGPKIVTDGLVLYLDAANTKSYPGTGTVWKGLSNEIELDNIGAIFSTTNGVSAWDFAYGTERLVLSSANTKIPNSYFTISTWVKSNDITKAQNIISKNAPYFMRIVGSKIRFNVNSVESGWLFQNGTTILESDKWYFLTMSWDGQIFKGYINGVEEFSVTYVGTLSTGQNSLFIGYTTSVGEQSPFDGRIAMVKMNNYALPIESINKDFNATKSRFL